jgi:hypothetical protein
VIAKHIGCTTASKRGGATLPMRHN